jgi:hypothetical protein
MCLVRKVNHDHIIAGLIELNNMIRVNIRRFRMLVIYEVILFFGPRKDPKLLGDFSFVVFHIQRW